MTKEELSKHEYVLKTTQYGSFVEYTPHSARDSLVSDIANCLCLSSVRIDCFYFRGVHLSALNTRKIMNEARSLNISK